ncbi:LPS-assembly lipoprotein LptE precursor [Vibrio aerogenes CECT 7868]|uniref:LPS-assembly lipoprotein LptE n=1 Tax=Vibrio aerogenes CECT 7868 TaxID=1216006 RepID=A0A1M5Z161_9VIBR|nr:LPS assembly lipoprotein LptE [Vibrio aerogenes]SHI17920.1 LPS-assembly lipoprotein LptE precursor [Vibrio aerogenes CECT 7868]
MQFIKKYRFQYHLIVCLSMLLTACGFHLRGDYDIPESLNRLSMTSYDQYSQLTRMIKNQLHMNEVRIVPPAENTPNLHLMSEAISSRTLSVYQNTRAAEEELTLKVTYQVTIPEIGARQFVTSVTRSYLDNPLTALAKSVERTMIEEEMRQLATSQIIRQMARLKSNIKNIEQNQPETQQNIPTIKITTNELVPQTSIH